MINRDGMLEFFCSGRRFKHRGAVGLSMTGQDVLVGADSEIAVAGVQGSDALTQDEKRELACHMIAAWSDYADRA